VMIVEGHATTGKMVASHQCLAYRENLKRQSKAEQKGDKSKKARHIGRKARGPRSPVTLPEPAQGPT
jgi:hypothetical protein